MKKKEERASAPQPISGGSAASIDRQKGDEWLEGYLDSLFDKRRNAFDQSPFGECLQHAIKPREFMELASRPHIDSTCEALLSGTQASERGLELACGMLKAALVLMANRATKRDAGLECLALMLCASETMRDEEATWSKFSAGCELRAKERWGRGYCSKLVEKGKLEAADMMPLHYVPLSLRELDLASLPDEREVAKIALFRLAKASLTVQEFDSLVADLRAILRQRRQAA